MTKKFNKRAFISLVTFFLSIMVLITGLILLIMPDATLAYWNKWTLLGLEKNDWESFHAVISIYITVIIVLHILENWKTMLSYMKSKKDQPFKNKKELAFALALSFVLILGSAVKTPISSITAVFEPAQDIWYSKKDEPPFEDTQGLALNLLIKLDMISVEKIKSKFEENSIVYSSLDETLEDIADNNNISSKELYELIKKK